MCGIFFNLVLVLFGLLWLFYISRVLFKGSSIVKESDFLSLSVSAFHSWEKNLSLNMKAKKKGFENKL